VNPSQLINWSENALSILEYYVLHLGGEEVLQLQLILVKGKYKVRSISYLNIILIILEEENHIMIPQFEFILP
jgi:hypothetical protein